MPPRKPTATTSKLASITNPGSLEPTKLIPALPPYPFRMLPKSQKWVTDREVCIMLVECIFSVEVDDHLKFKIYSNVCVGKIFLAFVGSITLIY